MPLRLRKEMAERWRYVADPDSDYCKKADTVLRRVRKIISKKQDMTRGFEGMYFAEFLNRYALEEKYHECSMLDARKAYYWKMLCIHAHGKIFRSKKVVKCSESDQPAEVLVDASPDSPSKPQKRFFSIRKIPLKNPLFVRIQDEENH
jgi:hypothetical protein